MQWALEAFSNGEVKRPGLKATSNRRVIPRLGVEVYRHSFIYPLGLVLNQAQGQVYFNFTLNMKIRFIS
jgi:hypothetical protein